MTEKRFETVKIDRSIQFYKDGIEISAFIAGVNSGVYGFPFVIAVRTWARNWFFKKFFYREIHLNMEEVAALHNELGKVVSQFKKIN